MQDYRTRLTADTSQHDNALKRSAQQVYQYKQKAEETDKSIGKLAGKFSKFVGVLSVAKIASEGFNSVMRNNQTAADNYGATMEVAKRISDEFFYSISKADFSTMINGLGSCISTAREYYNALDNLQTLQLGLIGENARLDKEMQKARTRVRKGDETAVKDIERISKQMLNNVQKEQASINNTLSKMIKSTAIGSGSSGDYKYTFDRGFDVEQVQRWVSGVENLDIAITQAKNKWMDLKDKASEYNDMNGIHSQVAMAEAEYKALEALKDKMSDGDNMKEFEQMYAKMQNLEAQYEQMEQRNLRYTKELGADRGINHKTPKIKVETEIEPLPEGSIAALEEQISNLNKSFRLAATDEDRQKFKQQIEEAQAELDKLLGKEKKIEIQPVIPEGSIAYLQLQLKALRDQFENTPDAELRIKLIADMSELERQLKDMQTTDAERAAEALTKRLQNMQNEAQATASAFDAMGNVFTNLGSCMDETAQQFLSGVGSIISSIGAVIPQIASLIAAEEGEAMASGLAGAAKVEPWPAKVAAIASIVAQILGVIGTIASISKFADGGIIGGATSIGDYNLARVNRGEMILNSRQQQRLFNMLNNGSVFNGFNADQTGNVTFTIHGSDLQGTLNNYNRKTGRVR